MFPGPRINQKAVTLVELVVGIALFSIIVLAVSQLDLFSNTSVIFAQRNVRLSNEASLAMEHISGNLNSAIGDITNPAADNYNIAGDPSIEFWVDSNSNFMRDAADTQRAYRWTYHTGPQDYLLLYCNRCRNAGCTQCVGETDGAFSSWGVVVARGVSYFGAPFAGLSGIPGTPVSIIGNYASIQIQICHDPTNPETCGTTDNPQASMVENIRMPSFSSGANP